MVLLRHGRAAELAGQAADLAFEMYGADSLVAAELRVRQVQQLWAHSFAEPSRSGAAALQRSAWSLLMSVASVLMQRLASGTLLLGACREEERVEHAHLAAAVMLARGKAAPSDSTLRSYSSAVGYNLLLLAANHALVVMVARPLPGPERARGEGVVHAGLDAVPATAGLVPFQPAAELALVAFVEQHMGERGCLDPAFHAAVMAKWRSPALANALRARGSLGRGVAAFQQTSAGDNARQRADAAARGYRTCGLPACGRLETSVRHFKLCGGCDAVAYCCEGHHDEHWREGHRRECHLRAAGAKPLSTADTV